MANEVSQLTVPASSTGVVVQSVAKGAWKTFRQGVGATIMAAIVALVLDWTTGALGGELPGITDFRALGVLLIALVIGFFAAAFSYIQNTYFTKTLLPGHTVEAEVKP